MENIVELQEKVIGLNGKDICLCGIGIVDCLVSLRNIISCVRDNKIILSSSISSEMDFNEVNVDVASIKRWKQEDNSLILFFQEDWFLKIVS